MTVLPLPNGLFVSSVLVPNWDRLVCAFRVSHPLLPWLSRLVRKPYPLSAISLNIFFLSWISNLVASVLYLLLQRFSFSFSGRQLLLFLLKKNNYFKCCRTTDSHFTFYIIKPVLLHCYIIIVDRAGNRIYQWGMAIATF